MLGALGLSCSAWTSTFHLPGRLNAAWDENTPLETCFAFTLTGPIPLSIWVNFICTDLISNGFLLESNNEILKLLLPTVNGSMDRIILSLASSTKRVAIKP